jgi:hypothetical protein
MRPIREILKEFRTRPFSYWFGVSESFTYEIAEGCVYKISASGRRCVFVLRDIQSWKRNIQDKTISLYQADAIRVIGDRSDKLGSILEKELPDRWVVDDPIS